MRPHCGDGSVPGRGTAAGPRSTAANPSVTQAPGVPGISYPRLWPAAGRHSHTALGAQAARSKSLEASSTIPVQSSTLMNFNDSINLQQGLTGLKVNVSLNLALKIKLCEF